MNPRDDAVAHAKRGAALARSNRSSEALASIDAALALDPGWAEAHFVKAIILLMLGDFAQGWTEYEWRWQTAHGRALRQRKNYSRPEWRGAPSVTGKTLLIYCERGLGDTVQFCRYAKLASALGARVILQVQTPLAGLLRSLSPVVQITGEAQPLPPFDLQCALLSLPLAFNTALNTIPASAKYLSVSAVAVATVREKLGARGRPRIGLVWRGDPDNPDDRQRSIALRDMLKCLPAQLQYFSLQKDLAPQEAALLGAHPQLSVFADDLDFGQTAALCECLDLVISIDSSVAHVAAALGRKTWILLPFNPDCRWLLHRDDSPWYPSVKLYRQSAPDDWRAVLAAVAADLTLKGTVE